jgi:hypothetical protein
MTNPIQKAKDFTIDALDKVSSPGSRAGATVERVAKMCKANVAPEVIALQMKMNSVNNQNYTPDDIKAYAKLYKDTKTRVPLTKAQATAIIEDQKKKEHKTEGSIITQGI